MSYLGYAHLYLPFLYNWQFMYICKWLHRLCLAASSLAVVRRKKLVDWNTTPIYESQTWVLNHKARHVKIINKKQNRWTVLSSKECRFFISRQKGRKKERRLSCIGDRFNLKTFLKIVIFLPNGKSEGRSSR